MLRQLGECRRRAVGGEVGLQPLQVHVAFERVLAGRVQAFGDDQDGCFAGDLRGLFFDVGSYDAKALTISGSLLPAAMSPSRKRGRMVSRVIRPARMSGRLPSAP